MEIGGITLEPHWWWLVVALILGIAEIVVPGFFLIWLGAAALVTGFVTLLIGIPAAAQLALFAVLAIAAVYVGRRWFTPAEIASDDPLLNDRAARLVGEVVTVVEPIEAGQGRVKVGDGVWNARGDDAPVGAKVRIVSAQGTLLIVEPVDGATH